jgi:hypothetical protein
MSPDFSTPTELNDQNLARLMAHLSVPLTVQSILDGAETLDDAARYALSDQVASQTPDQALLSIALSTMVLDARLRAAGVRAAEIVSMSAEMMVQDYAPLYLSLLSSGGPTTLLNGPHHDYFETIPEDLESLSDLLAVVAQVTPDGLGVMRDMATLLSLQAGAQGLVAETLVEAMEAPLLFADLDEGTTPATALNVAQTDADNVVPFKRR